MIQCYFGNGKGKTTASVGAAIRYLGCQKRVLFVSFLKDGTSSELEILKTIPTVKVKIPAVSYHLFDNQNPKKSTEFSQAYTRFFCEEIDIMSSQFDMIVLDEILDVVAFGYIAEDTFLKKIKQWSNTAELVLTGHRLSPKIAECCDYISEICSRKHPYEIPWIEFKHNKYIPKS